jgi:hypothetical protein
VFIVFDSFNQLVALGFGEKNGHRRRIDCDLRLLKTMF